jgi:hypothetical protein
MQEIRETDQRENAQDICAVRRTLTRVITVSGTRLQRKSWVRAAASNSQRGAGGAGLPPRGVLRPEISFKFYSIGAEGDRVRIRIEKRT